MVSHHKQNAPEGHVAGPAVTFVGISVLLALMLQFTGLLKPMNAAVLSLIQKPIFNGETPKMLDWPTLAIVACAFSLGVAFAVLDTPGKWRRFLLGLTALVIVIVFVPSLGVWGIYFPPALTLIALFWTWFCCVMYANHHLMPCDLGVVSNTPIAQEMPAQIVPQTLPEEEVLTESFDVDGVEEEHISLDGLAEMPIEQNDPDIKYMPKKKESHAES